MTDSDCCVLAAVGEPHDGTETAIRQVEEKWEQLNKLLADTQRVVDQNFETKKFYSELTTLIDLVAGYEKWMGAAEKIADEAQEISKQLDQCKVRSALCAFQHKMKIALCVFQHKMKIALCAFRHKMKNALCVFQHKITVVIYVFLWKVRRNVLGLLVQDEECFVSVSVKVRSASCVFMCKIRSALCVFLCKVRSAFLCIPVEV